MKIKNHPMWWVLGGTTAALAAVLSVPFLRSLFHFSPLPAAGLLVAFAGGVISLLWFEGLKWVWKNLRIKS